MEAYPVRLEMLLIHCQHDESTPGRTGPPNSMNRQIRTCHGARGWGRRPPVSG
jgi:hypothetical protein